MDLRGGARRPPPSHHNQRPGGFNHPVRQGFHGVHPRMMNTNLPWHGNNVQHQHPGNNYPPVANNYGQPDIPVTSRMMMSQYNEQPVEYSSYYVGSEIPASPPTFQQIQYQPPTMYLPQNMPGQMFSPTSPMDSNVRFVNQVVSSPSPSPITVQPNPAIPGRKPYLNKRQELVHCVACGHCNYYADSEISNLENEIARLKNTEVVSLQNEIVNLNKRIKDLEMELKNREPLALMESIAQESNSILSPDAEEFNPALSATKEVKPSEVPVVSAKVIDEQSAEIPTETEETETMNEAVVTESIKIEDAPGVIDLETAQNQNNPPIETVEIKSQAAEEFLTDNIKTETVEEDHVKLEVKQEEGDKLENEVSTNNSVAESYSAEKDVEIAVDGVHTSCQTLDGWNSSENLAISDQPQNNDGFIPVSSHHNYNNQSQHFKRDTHNNWNRGRNYDQRGRGRGMPQDRNDNNRYSNTNQHRGDRGGSQNFRAYDGNNSRNFGARPGDLRGGGRPETYPRNQEDTARPRYQRDRSSNSSNRGRVSEQRDVSGNGDSRDPLSSLKHNENSLNGGGGLKPHPKNVLRELKGDLFTAASDFSLAHCVAKDFQMSRGIAVKFRDEFKGVAQLMEQKVNVGGCAYLKDEKNNRYIFYLVTKQMSNAKPTMLTLTQSLQALREKCEELNVTKLAMPRIGCGLDSLRWFDVKNAINQVFQDAQMQILVYDWNVEGVPESQQDSKKDSVVVVYKQMDLVAIDKQTALLIFGTEDGFMDATAKKLDNRFKFHNEYKSAEKTVGKVWRFTKTPGEDYYIYSLIVAKSHGAVSFVDIGNCCKELVKMLREDAWPYVGLEALVDWSDEDVFTEKVVNLLRFSLPRKHVRQLWVCFSQVEHDVLKQCSAPKKTLYELKK